MPANLTDSHSHSFDEFLSRHLERDLLRFTTAGSVDDGKSTLIGRLLYDSRAVYEDQVQSIRQSGVNRSSGPLDFSLLTDGLRAEREQGITIDVAYRYFTTEKRKFIIADTPGHEQYTRNMATGASTADAAVVLVDVRKGILHQSRRHASIAALLGIPHIIAAINKMDLVGYSEEVFRRLEADVAQLASQISAVFASGGPELTIRCIPVSALEGENVVRRSDRIAWYRGPSLLETLEQLPLSGPPASAPIRFPVQYVIRPNDSFRGFAGQIVSGTITPGDRVLALPSGQRTAVESIVTYDGRLSAAVAGSSVTLQLAAQIDLSRGGLIVSEDNLPHQARRFAANVVWLHATPLELRRRWIVRHATDEFRVHARHIRHRINMDTMARSPATSLESNDIGVVEFEATRQFAFDLYRENRSTGSFILIDPLTNATVGAGMITESLDGRDDFRPKLDANPPSAVAHDTSDAFRDLSSVAASERSRRFGHHPAAIWLGAWSPLAAALERALFDAGYHAIVLDEAESPSEWNQALIRSFHSAGIVALYSAANMDDARKHHLQSAIPKEHVLDAEAIDSAEGSGPVIDCILAWVERLRIPDRGEGK